MIIEIKIKIACFRKIKRNQYRAFLEQMWLDPDTVSPLIDRWSAQLVTECVLHPESDHAECRRVCIFSSGYWSKKSKSNRQRILYFKNWM